MELKARSLALHLLSEHITVFPLAGIIIYFPVNISHLKAWNYPFLHNIQCRRSNVCQFYRFLHENLSMYKFWIAFHLFAHTHAKKGIAALVQDYKILKIRKGNDDLSQKSADHLSFSRAHFTATTLHFHIHIPVRNLLIDVFSSYLYILDT